MITRGLIPIAVAALLASAGCAVRMGAKPADATPAGVSRGAAPEAARSPAPPEGPVAGTAAAEAPNAAALDANQPTAGRETAVRPVGERPAKATAPAATASAFVFSPREAVSARPSAPPAAGSAQVESPSRDAAVPETPSNGNPGELQLNVVASAPQIAPGGIMTVDVMASSNAAVVDAPLHLTFDPSVVEFIDGATGDFLTQGGSSVVFLADGRSRPGEVAIAAGRVEREQGARGAGLLCRVRFRGVSPGTTPVVVAQAQAWGTQGEELTVVGGGTSVAVN